MKRKSVVFLSAFFFFTMACGIKTAAAAKVESPHERLLREYHERRGQKTQQQKAAEQQQPKSIWDDDSASNPYFRSSNKKVRTAADVKAEKEASKAKKSTFKRRVYTGPSKDEINAAASKKAVENFKAFFVSEKYDIKYDKISYSVPGDSLSVVNFRMIPKKGSPQEKNIPYYLTAKELSLRNFNIGEKDNTEMLEDGELKARKVEIPVWDENAVKKGKIEISQLKMTGDVPSYLKAQGEGELKTVELSNLRSETIINETVLNNIVRSKIFAASSATFVGVELQKDIIEALKHQKLDGLKFTMAQVNSRNIPTPQGVAAAMTSYSARVLNTDLVLGARLEAQKDKPVANMEQLKKNANENKAAVAAVEAEMKLN